MFQTCQRAKSTINTNSLKLGKNYYFSHLILKLMQKNELEICPNSFLLCLFFFDYFTIHDFVDGRSDFAPFFARYYSAVASVGA